ncbi:MAG: DUF3786 domain-containing protein [Dehalococcoidia bacterium]
MLPGQDKAIKDFQNLSPLVAAAKSGCDFQDGVFRLPLFDRTFLISHPQGRVVEEGRDSHPPPVLEMVLLHYLITADGTALADRWIAYRHLPGAFLFASRFESLAIRTLATALHGVKGQDIKGFRRSALALRGETMSRTGDAAFRFLALPRIPMACILYLGDEEVAPSINILFDGSAHHYLPTEDLSYLGSYLSQALRSHK